MTPRRGGATGKRWPAGRIACAVLLVLWCVASWTLSAQSDPQEYVGVRLRLPDKLEHAMYYAAGGVVAAGVVRGTRRAPRWAAAVLFCGLWGVSDEIHQSWVPGRYADGMDVAADVSGASVGAALFVLWSGRRQPSRSEVDESEAGPQESDVNEERSRR